jgi:uncharacterized damage-inducible protein DinB
MSEIEQIVDELKCAFDGEAWHGPALMEILDGVDAKTAAARPVAEAHNIWELVLHLTGWEGVIIRRIRGSEATLTDNENFGNVAETTEVAWRRAVENLRQTHGELIQVVSSIADEKLRARVPGKSYDIVFMLHGAAQHAAYHGGQIALLKRAQA